MKHLRNLLIALTLTSTHANAGEELPTADLSKQILRQSAPSNLTSNEEFAQTIIDESFLSDTQTEVSFSCRVSKLTELGGFPSDFVLSVKPEQNLAKISNADGSLSMALLVATSDDMFAAIIPRYMIEFTVNDKAASQGFEKSLYIELNRGTGELGIKEYFEPDPDMTDAPVSDFSLLQDGVCEEIRND